MKLPLPPEWTIEYNGSIDNGGRSRRLRRPLRSEQQVSFEALNTVVLSCASKGLTIQRGDCVYFEDRYGLIREIVLDTFGVEISVVIMKTKQEVLDMIGPAEIPMIDVASIGQDYELFLTPKQSSLKVLTITKKVNVFSEQKYAGQLNLFMCRYCLDYLYFSEPFDYELILPGILSDNRHFKLFMTKLLYDENPMYLATVNQKKANNHKQQTSQLRKRALPLLAKVSKGKKPAVQKTKEVKVQDKDSDEKQEEVQDRIEEEGEEEEKEEEFTRDNNIWDDSDSSDSSIEELLDPEYFEEELSEVVKRPRKQPKTSLRPTTPRKGRRTPQASPKKTRNTPQPTPKAPSIPARALKNSKDTQNNNLFAKAKEQLHPLALVGSLPSREKEYERLYVALESLVCLETGRCIYISGTPGTGKTATVRKVVESLKERREIGRQMRELEASAETNSESALKLAKMVELGEADKQKEYLGDFAFLEINGLKLISASACYEKLWEKISGEHVSAKSAKNLIDAYLEERDPNRRPLIVLLDEIDQIITRNQSIMYNFFNWPTYPNLKLIVIAIANTMDLPERVLTNKISSRLGLDRILFPGYTYDELAEIITMRLLALKKTVGNKTLQFEQSAIEFASRKVASVSGDARRALLICRRAVEMAEQECLSKGEEGAGIEYVKIGHIIKAIQETTYLAVSVCVMNLSVMAKVFLAALLRRQKYTGLQENEISELMDEVGRIVLMDFAHLADSNYQSVLAGGVNLFDAYMGSGGWRQRAMAFDMIVEQMVESGVIVQERSRATQSRLIKLCVPEDEIQNALRKERVFQKILG